MGLFCFLILRTHVIWNFGISCLFCFSKSSLSCSYVICFWNSDLTYVPSYHSVVMSLNCCHIPSVSLRSPWLIASYLYSSSVSLQPCLIGYFAQLLNFYFKSCIIPFYMSNLFFIFISNAQSSLQSFLPYLYIWFSFYFKQITY